MATTNPFDEAPAYSAAAATATTTTPSEPPASQQPPAASLEQRETPTTLPQSQSPPATTTTSDTPSLPQRPPQQQQPEHPVSPEVATLRSMFPDFDEGVLLSVLQSVGNDQNRAIEVLLGMSDPEYKAETRPQPEQRPMSQEELDEQLARRLLMEEEQQQQAMWQQQQGGPPQQWYPQGRGPYRAPAGPGSTGQERDTMTELGEQFNKFAETSKRTLGNIFTKVKAKVQEFDQQRIQNQPPGAPGPASGVGGDTYPYDHGQNPYPTSSQGPPPPTVPTSSARPGSSSPPPMRGYEAGQARGYDATPSPPPSSTTGPPIDGGKIGLLPKRPVSLLGNSPPPAAEGGSTVKTGTSIAVKHDDDDDALEYTENPFETDGRKK